MHDEIEEIHQNYQATFAAKNDPFKKHGVLFHDPFPEQIQVLFQETNFKLPEGRVLQRLFDMCIPKDLGPSNGRVWTCIAGLGSSK